MLRIRSKVNQTCNGRSQAPKYQHSFLAFFPCETRHARTVVKPYGLGIVESFMEFRSMFNELKIVQTSISYSKKICRIHVDQYQLNNITNSTYCRDPLLAFILRVHDAMSDNGIAVVCLLNVTKRLMTKILVCRTCSSMTHLSVFHSLMEIFLNQ